MKGLFAYYGRSNPNKSNAKSFTNFYFIWCDVKLYLFKKNVHHNVLKNANIFKKWLKWFLILGNL
jgi:hypothetical protein